MTCPACEGSARIVGKIISESRPKDVDGELVQESLFLPVRLKCFSCSLRLDGHDYLHGIGLGGQFKRKDYIDPVEHFGIDPGEYGWVDPESLREEDPDYGND